MHAKLRIKIETFFKPGLRSLESAATNPFRCFEKRDRHIWVRFQGLPADLELEL